MSTNDSKRTTTNRCKECHEPILSEEQYLNDGDNMIHIHCYVCSNCHKSLAGMFYYRYNDPQHSGDKALYCDECYHRLAPVCFQCLKIIEDISLTYGERIFHPNCFICNHCKKAFKGALVFPYENHVYCANCYNHVQNEFRSAPSKLLGTRCFVCRKTFQPGDLITKHQRNSVTNKSPTTIHYLHNSCFVCEICRRNLSNSVYYSPNHHDEDLQHLVFQCHECHRASSSSSVCSSCFKPSDDLMIAFNNRWYHDECFTCRKCKYSLKNLTRIVSESDGLLCERCLKVIRDQQQEEQI